MESKREAAKSERRQRIIVAARELIRETGDAGLSMRALAARAGVSLATPYNLFGSKRAVLLAVLEDIKGFGHRFASYGTLNPLDKLLRAAELAISYYEKDPVFYRVLWTSVLAAAGAEERDAIFNPKRQAFWIRLLDEASAAGLLMEGIDTNLLLRSLDYSFRSVMLHWVIGEIEVENLQAAAGLGYALALRGAASAEGQALLTERVFAFQRALSEGTAPKKGAVAEEVS
ncbi:TetR/AcrR family transcriptional regulator [Chelatococcus reniformis]|uniref:HTH tetR-type domain-containing protein n=1 Tax=Chelatococcus reniformis TaxID=1494448 RepID=A0A916XRD6_9HYPH|nr:TetR/AcrR family transcriptional regulator [Chelatococcus reniformis]GGC92086.1 hypothetical protein GCM10010994_57360 [Chelatococcus reniformis]